MIPSITALRMSGARNRAELPLLVLGPSLGTSATTLWSQCAAGLADAFDLTAWDLPGHGHNHTVPDEPFTMAELAAGVLRVVDDVLAERGDVGGSFLYAGVSVGGAVGLQLMLDQPDRVAAAALLCTGAKIGDQALWAERMGQVGASGTPGIVSASAERWFGPGFLDRSPEVGSALLHALQQTDDKGYIQVCGALATFDVRDRLADIAVPVLAVAAPHDVAAPPAGLRTIADGVKDGRYVELDGVAHLAPAEAPEAVAGLLRHHFLGEEPSPGDDSTVRELRDAGMVVRREVLGDAHVDRAIGRRHRLHARLPGVHHPVRLGRHLDPTRTRPSQPLPDHPHRADRAGPPRGARPARPGSPPQRTHGRRDQGAHPADRRLLRRPRRQHRLPHRPGGTGARPGEPVTAVHPRASGQAR